MTNEEPKAQPQPSNRRRRFDMILQIILAALAGGGVAYSAKDVKALNGLYTTREEGAGIRENIREIRETQVANSIANATAQANTVTALAQLRADMNTNFASLKVILVDNKSAQSLLDNKQSLDISEIKLLLKPKQVKEN